MLIYQTLRYVVIIHSEPENGDYSGARPMDNLWIFRYLEISTDRLFVQILFFYITSAPFLPIALAYLARPWPAPSIGMLCSKNTYTVHAIQTKL